MEFGCTMTSGKALLVDYGGVLTEDMSVVHARFCSTHDIDPESLADVLREWVDRPDLDSPARRLESGDLSTVDFERLLAARLRSRDGTKVPGAGLLRALFAGTRLDAAMMAVVGTIRARGVRTAVVSNAWGSDYPTDLLRAGFDELVFSNVVGMRKPDPDIYLHTARVLGVSPADCVFVDDRKTNVDGAVAVGMTGLHYVDTQDAATTLFAHFGIDVPGAAV